MLSAIAVMEGCRSVRRSIEGALTEEPWARPQGRRVGERRLRAAPAGPPPGR
jgi:hypothetical protein